MLVHRLIGLFHKRCPLCRQQVRAQSQEAVQRFGKWFCTKAHADLYELELYKALHTVRCPHAGCHGDYVPLPAAVCPGCSSRSTAQLAGRQEERG